MSEIKRLWLILIKEDITKARMIFDVCLSFVNNIDKLKIVKCRKFIVILIKDIVQRILIQTATSLFNRIFSIVMFKLIKFRSSWIVPDLYFKWIISSKYKIRKKHYLSLIFELFEDTLFEILEQNLEELMSKTQNLMVQIALSIVVSLTEKKISDLIEKLALD